jgi:hypothetical protein
MAQEKSGGVKPAGAITLFFVIFLVGILGMLIHRTPISVTGAAYSLLTAAIMTGFLSWLVTKVRLSLASLALLLWLELFAVEYFVNYIEGFFFTTLFEGSYYVPLFGSKFASAVVSSLAVSLIVAASATLLIGQRGVVVGIMDSLSQHLSTRKAGPWVLRIVAGSIVYFPIYFFFGLLVTPFVLPYYNNPSFGLRIPSFSVMLPVELFRGLLFVLVLLPLLAAVAGGRTTRFVVLASMLYIPGGLVALLGSTSLPAQIVPFHAVEILADSIVYGLVLSRILQARVKPSP